MWHQLRELGCPFAQGFYLSRPLLGDQMTRWLERHNSTSQYDANVKAVTLVHSMRSAE